jgi:tetratricopeptide (TPR) repeat protein
MKTPSKKLKVLLQQGKLDTAFNQLQRQNRKISDEERWLSLGDVCHENGFHSAYFQCCIACLKINPQNAYAYYGAGNACFKTGDIKKALQFTQQAVMHGRNDPKILSAAGILLQKSGRHDGAIQYFLHSLKHDPNNAMVHSLAGRSHQLTGNAEQAVLHYKKSLELNPRLEKSLMWLSAHYQTVGDFDNSLHFINEALKVSPKSPSLLSIYANLLTMLGKKSEAYKIVRGLIDDDKHIPFTLNVYSILYQNHGDTSELVKLLENEIKRTSISDADKRMLGYALGKVYDSLGKYESAFRYYKLANNLNSSKYHIEAHVAHVQEIVDVYNQEYTSALPQYSESNDSPIFIIGMPRSGTTLVEQILSRHPKVHATGELTFIVDIVRNLCGKLATNNINLSIIRQLNVEDFKNRAEEYMCRVTELLGSADRFTDKLPTNYMYLGLISQMFPKAKIIHCNRDPRDTCLSIYFQDLGSFHAYSNDLCDTAYVYSEYVRLMNHWRNVLNIPILDIYYEDIVSDIKGNVERILDFCDLDWEDECLLFYKSERLVATSSFDQVKQPIYNQSAGRWRNYKQHLGDIEQILKPVL